ncbi:MAG: SDR family NAD(P)-dependent oxidoreductase [Akkermansiaceae bacterium]
MKTALITGGHGDLAQATASALETSGMRALTPGRDELDVSNKESISSYFTSAGEIDLIVCNAGIIHDQMLTRMSEHEWDEVMETNLHGAFRCARAVARGMSKRRQGHIIFIGSFSGIHPPVGQANYAAAKAGLLGMTASMAKELGSRNIRVNTILPGFMETNMTANLPAHATDRLRSAHCLTGFNTPQSAASFITHLHHHLPHTSGQVFNLDSRIA